MGIEAVDAAIDPAMQEVIDEAEWEITTAEALKTKGDFQGAREWYRRAVERLMDAGLDERALEVARVVAELADAVKLVSEREVTGAERSADRGVYENGGDGARAAEGDARAERISEVPVTLEPGVLESAPAPPPVPERARVPMFETADAVAVGGESKSRAVLHLPLPQVIDGGPMVLPAITPTLRPDGVPVAKGENVPLRAAVSWRPSRNTDVEQLKARLVTLPLLADIPGEALKLLSMRAQCREFAKGEVMVPVPTRGEMILDGPLWVIVEGSARAVAGGVRVGAELRPGDFVGELGAWYGVAGLTETVAEERVLAVGFAPSLLRALGREFPGVREAVEESAWERAFVALGLAAPVLTRVDAGDREGVYGKFDPTMVSADEALFDEGELVSHVWLIAAGEVEIYGGGVKLVDFVRARGGDLLGVTAVLDEAPSGVSARALRPTLAAKVSAGEFRALAARVPALARTRWDVGVVDHGVLC